MIRPAHLTTEHWYELTVESLISPEIATLNFATLEGGNYKDWERDGNQVVEMLLGHMMQGGWSSQYASNNDLRYWLKELETVARKSGLWCQGTNEWGQFKPAEECRRVSRRSDRTPKTNADGSFKLNKYESPPKMPMGVYMMRPRNWNVLRSDVSIKLAITEGAKKTASLESANQPTVGLSGANGGVVKDAMGILRLRPELQEIDWNCRRVVIVRDHDPACKVNTCNEVDKAWMRFGALLVKAGARLSVASIPVEPNHPKMGIDDYRAVGGRLSDLKVATYSQWAQTRTLELQEMMRKQPPIKRANRAVKLAPPVKQHKGLGV